MENNATYGWEPEETKVSPMPPSEHQIENSDNPPEESFLPENEEEEEEEEDSYEDEEIKEIPDEEEIEDDDEIRTDEQNGDAGYDNSRQNNF